MAIPDFQTLMLPVLRSAVEGEVRISDVVEQLAGQFRLTLDERSQLLPSGKQTTFANRVHWAKTYLTKAGLVEITRRGHYRITPTGKEVLCSPPPAITIQFLYQFSAFQEFRDARAARPPASPVADNAALTPDETMRRAYEEVNATLADTMLQRVRSSTPAFFERVVVTLLVAMGYGGMTSDIDTALVGKAGDGGVDGVIDQDPLGLDRVYVQAKRYGEGNAVGAREIRDFFGSLDRYKAAKGLFVTTSTFTRDARDTADMLSKRIVLIDGTQLSRLMLRHRVGCRVIETLDMLKEDEDFFTG